MSDQDFKQPIPSESADNCILPDCGIYFLLNEGEIVYVGQSKRSVRQRILQHRKDKVFDSFFVKPYERKSLDFMEAMYIFVHTPKYNKVMPKAQDSIYKFIDEKPYWKGISCKCKVDAVLIDGKLYVDVASVHDNTKPLFDFEISQP